MIAKDAIRYSLGFLLASMALFAFGGGYYGMSGAPGVPTEWLEGSPFRTYFAPSLILFTVVGGSHLVAAVGVLFRRSFAERGTDVAGAVAIVWIAVQIAVIGYVSWLQPAVVGVAVTALLLNRALSNPTGERSPHRSAGSRR
jgi:hypothetical protein